MDSPVIVILLAMSSQYSFQATNEIERKEWIEKITNAILEALNLAPEQKDGKKGVRAVVSEYEDTPFVIINYI